MAAKVILQSEDAKKQEKVKRSAADYLVRQLMAIQIGAYLYRRLKVKAAVLHQSTRIASKLFIPDKMPSHKAPGTKTRGPVVEQDGFGRARIVIANMIAAGR